MKQQFDVDLSWVRVLPFRPGPSPRTSRVLPFRQLDQFSPAEIHAQLMAECAGMPGVRLRESRMALSGTAALWLPDEMAGGPSEAFIDLHEFCHLHPLPEGTIHVVLPGEVMETALALRWAERHPIASTGILTSLAMVYAPRNPPELAVVLGLIGWSRRFACGELDDAIAHVA
jgi:hypothetical protein